MLSPPDDVDELFQCYDDTITAILDKLAPYADVRQYARRTSPWYDRECHITKLKTRRLEKAFRRRPSPAAKSLWRAQFNQQRKLFQQKFVDHWSHKISSSKGNSKTMWSHLKCLLTRPEQTVAEHSPDDFARHFQDKIERIRSSTAEFCHPTIVSRNVDTLDVFEPVSVEEVATMIRKSPSKQCPLDQGRSQPKKRRGTSIWQGARGWVRTMSPLPLWGPGFATPPHPDFLYILNTKSLILVHSLAPKMENGHYQCFYQDPYALGEMKSAGGGC